MSAIGEVNDESFIDEVIHGSDEAPVLVECWAEWCHPCRDLLPELEALAEELSGRLKVTKLNVDECPALAELFGVSLVPTMLLFVEGVIEVMIQGYQTKDAILSGIQPHLKAAS